jgi:uncharacterized membrane protein YeaQ/YmgE (transglycosylase-associated protein family)
MLPGVATPKIPKEMVSLASHILETKAGHFDPSQFKDEFETELRKLVKRKAARKTIEAPGREERPSNVVDLMEALRQSVIGKRVAALRSSVSSSKKTSKPQSRKSAQESENPSEQPDALEPARSQGDTPMAIGSTALFNLIIILIIGTVAGLVFNRYARSWLVRLSSTTRSDVTTALVGIAGAFIGFHISVILGLLPSPLMHYILAAFCALIVLWLWRGR